MNKKFRLAIIGCGAITRIAHLPAAIANCEIEIVALVDFETQRAKALARSHGVTCKIVRDHREILQEVDGIINALPNHLHVPVTLDALRAGVHVLCEKPLATTTLEARECCKLAAAKDLVLAVGMNRRFETGSTVLRCILNEGLLGSIREYEFEYGAPYDWNTASGFYFARAQAGGGVLLDYGVHMLDSVMDWFGPVVGFEYQDDNWGGGLEANTMLELQHCGAYGNVPGRLRLSRMYNLKNRLLITGTQYSAQIDIADQSTVLIHRIVDGQPVTFNARLQKDMERPRTTFFKQLDNFIQAVRGREKPVVDGWQALEVIDLIEKCYAQARRIPEPWSQICNSVTAP